MDIETQHLMVATFKTHVYVCKQSVYYWFKLDMMRHYCLARIASTETRIHILCLYEPDFV